MVKSENQRLDVIFHALGDSTRRAILRDVSSAEKSVSEIAEPYRMSLAAVSKHLKVLEKAKLVSRRKEGSFQWVKLNPTTLKSAEQWISYYQQFWGVRLDALQELLEKRKK